MTFNITKAREKLYEIAKSAINDNEIITINTKHGDAVLISKDNYESLLETLFLSSDANYRKSLIEGYKTPIDQCVSEDEVDW